MTAKLVLALASIIESSPPLKLCWAVHQQIVQIHWKTKLEAVLVPKKDNDFVIAVINTWSYHSAIHPDRYSVSIKPWWLSGIMSDANSSSVFSDFPQFESASNARNNQQHRFG